MTENETHQYVANENRLVDYCDQIIIAILYVTIIAVPLFFGLNLYSVFDLSKITVLYISVFTILAIWSVRHMLLSWKNGRQIPGVNRDAENVGMGSWTRAVGYYNTPLHLARPLNLPILAYLLVSGLATIFSIHPYTSLMGTYKRYDGFLSTVVYVCLFYAIVNFIEKKRLNSLINIIILTACIASVYGVLQHFGLDPFRWSTDFHFGTRAASTFGHPAFFSAFLIMVIPLVFVKIFSCKERIKPYLYMGGLALLTTTFYYTKTRASFVGLIVLSLFFFSLVGRKSLLFDKTKTLFTLIILVGISFFFFFTDESSVIGRFVQDIQPALLDSKQDEITNIQEKSVDQETPTPSGLEEKDYSLAGRLEGTMSKRVYQYITGLRVIYDYPILGIGPDTLGIIYPQYCAKVYREMGESKQFMNQNRIHNDFLDMIVSRGLLGLAVYVWFIFAYSRMVWKGYKNAEDLDKILIIGFCSGCLGYFIQNQFSFGHIPIITLCWFLIGMSVIVNPLRHTLFKEVGNSTTQESFFTRQVIHSPSLKRFIKCMICAIIVCLMVLLITLSFNNYKADIHFYSGRRLLNMGLINEAIKEYEMAVRYNSLEINYRNVLNGIYLKMAVAELNKSRDRADGKELPGLLSQEQTSIWFAKAISGAKEVQRLYPGDYRSAFQLGQAYHVIDGVLEKDMSKIAFNYYKKATTLYPTKYRMHNKFAQLCVEKGYYQEAIQELKELIQISPKDSKSYINLSNVYTKLENYKEAERTYYQLLELPGDADDKYKQYAKKMLETLPRSSKVE